MFPYFTAAVTIHNSYWWTLIYLAICKAVNKDHNLLQLLGLSSCNIMGEDFDCCHSTQLRVMSPK